MGRAGSGPGNRKCWGTSALPIGEKNAEQLLGQHDMAILPALATADVDHRSGAIDVLDGEHRRFRHAPVVSARTLRPCRASSCKRTAGHTYFD